jgi:hypothetical protein
MALLVESALWAMQAPTVVPYSPTIVGGVLCLPPQVCNCHMIGQLCQVGGSTAKANKTLVNKKDE